jgi:hypothetical protein
MTTPPTGGGAKRKTQLLLDTEALCNPQGFFCFCMQYFVFELEKERVELGIQGEMRIVP